MANLDISLPYTLAREGGYQYTQTPNDTGKGTYAGLTAKTVGSYFGHELTSQQMQSLTPQQVADIYRKLYWNVIRGDSIAQQVVATCVFDMAVLTGATRSAMMAQAVVNQKADGQVGPKTLAALGQVGVVAFVKAFAQVCNSYFDQIVTGDATQRGFLTGWKARTAKMDTITEI